MTKFLVLRHPEGTYRGAVVIDEGEIPTQDDAIALALEMKQKNPTQQFSIARVMLIAVPVAEPFKMVEVGGPMKPVAPPINSRPAR